MRKFFFLLFNLSTIVLMAQNSLTRRLDSLTSVYESNNYHGVILVAKGGQVLFQKGYGMANFEKGIKQTPGTLFKMESTGKMFTATAIMQLVEQGKLRLDQTLKELLPQLSIKNADQITVQHLLRHTSGLMSPWDHPQWNFKKVYTKEELMKIVTEVPLVFDQPGKSWFYSNSGYFILGWIIEKVSGQPYDQYFQQHFFKPLKMTSTRHLNDTIMPVKNGAQPYRIISDKKYISMTETIGPKASPAGGWISTAGDLYKFMLALSTGKLIKPSTLHLMNTANGTSPKDSAYKYYAFGLETYRNTTAPNTFIYGHSGGGAGFSIDAVADSASGVIIISCTNLNQNIRPITSKYFKAVFNQPLEKVTKSNQVLVCNKIEEIGIDSFNAHPKENFAALNIQIDPRMLVSVGDALSLGGDLVTSVKWMNMANELYPDDNFITMNNGDIQLKAGNKEAAQKLYRTVRDLATKSGDQNTVKVAEKKLKELNTDL